MENLFNTLLKEFVNLIPSANELEGFDIKTEETPNGFSITMTKKPKQEDELIKMRDEFKTYIDTIEDFFFEEACNKFNKVAGISLKEFENLDLVPENKNLIENCINVFKECVKESVESFIIDLKEKYHLD